jgi:hypothetical protein
MMSPASANDWRKQHGFEVVANQNNAGIYGTVARIGQLEVGQTIVLHRQP